MIYKDNSIFKISSNIIYRKIDEAFILLEIEGDRMFELEDVSALIWDGIVKQKSFKEISQSVSNEYEVTSENNAEIEQFITDLIKAQIISEKS